MARLRYVGESFWPQARISMEHAMFVCNVVSVCLRLARCELYVDPFCLVMTTSCRFGFRASIRGLCIDV